MTDAHSRFADFITQCAETLELPPPTVEGDSYMFQVGDRWIELKRNSRGDIVTFAAVIYIAPPETAVRPDLVASFNVYHLFNGGFTLVLEEETGVLRLCRPHRLSALEARNIRKDLIAFAETAAMAGTWYIRTSEETASGPQPLARDELGGRLNI